MATVREGEPVGQSFISRRAGLDGIQLWLLPEPGGGSQAGTLEAALYHAPDDDGPIYSTIVSIPHAANSSPLILPIPPRSDPPDQPYYIELRATGGSVQTLGRAEDVYPNGEAYAAGVPLPADLSFQLTYRWGAASLGLDLKRALRSLPLAIPLALALWLPGRLLVHLLRLDRGQDWGVRTALSVGFSLAAPPILMTWTSLARLSWSRTGVWAVMGILAVVYGWRILRPIRPRTSISNRSAGEQNDSLSSSPSLLSWEGVSAAELAGGIGLLAVFLFSLAVRLVMARDLAAPPWVDSVHHAMLAGMIQESGAFPASYLPYVDIETASYHPGFHTGLAVFSWLSGLEMIDALLVYGQVLNALAAVFGVYVFTVALTRDRLSGLLAALIAGVFTPMPAYYTSWGRYTQLAGMLLLPAAAAVIFMVLSDRQEGHARPVVGVAVLSAGLFLTHYRVVAFLVLLAAASLPGLLWVRRSRIDRPFGRFLGATNARLYLALRAERLWVQRSRSDRPFGRFSGGTNASLHLALRGERLRMRRYFSARHFSRPHNLLHARIHLALRGEALRKVGRLVVAGGLAVLLTLPWWPPLLATLVLPRLGYQPGGAAFNDFSWAYLTTAFGRYTLILAGLGALWGLVQRRGFPLLLALWVALMFGLANLHALDLPGAGLVNNTSVTILLYLPIAALGGYLLSWLICAWEQPLTPRWQSAYRAMIVVSAVGLALAGARALLPILNPSTVLFRQADRPAMRWIAGHVPAGETVLINPFNWGYGLYAGQDGGFWIVPSAGRPTLPPPVLAGFGNDPEQVTQKSDFVRAVLEAAGDPAALYDLLRAQGIQYLYLGARGGALSAAKLMGSGLFEPLYASQGTWVFLLVLP